ncbi:preprotein translocase subunit YajC [Nakamurella aerolata]|uniref:Preprotein translocase subunit YajC n=1 Tax=Nakamurella aerolata TaxID=1656892 RepID=A0A849A5T0_9ACTN|nr:preprotein translocase subunit YajC [Nakamurella aerolata]NNG34743.1 preprotein translocase subunit YajC [Nakamurella aerolata]
METMLLPIVMILALGAMMYFSVKKQKRMAAEQQKMQESIVPGTRVMTTSGLYGDVTAVADDTIELEIAPGLRTTWVRAAVREVVVPKAGGTDAVDGTSATGAVSGTDGSYQLNGELQSRSTDGVSDADGISLDKRRGDIG